MTEQQTSAGSPEAEPWRGLLGGLGPWRGTITKVNPFVQDGPRLIVWQCSHRHPSEGEAVDCAASRGAVAGRRPKVSRPGAARQGGRRRGRLANWLNLLGVGGR